MDNKIRLNKFLSEAGVCSRRKADELISAGKISVNKKIVTELGTQVDPTIDEILVDGQLCQIENKIVYYAIYKPMGTISTASDEKGRANVTDLVPKTPRVYPVGRLDAYSEGLMILTNDGELTQKLTHPSFEHEKEYEVIVRRRASEVISSDQIKREFEKGLLIQGKLMKADKVNINNPSKDSGLETNDSGLLTLTLILHTGYNRQIREMCDKLGLTVLHLKRIRIGKLNIANLNLKPGQCKEIKKTDIL